MNKVFILAALMLFLLSCGDSSTNINGSEEPQGNNTSDDPSTPSTPSTPNTPQQTAANAIVLTLTYWKTTDTDIGGLDPKIYFKVSAFVNGKSTSNNSNVLLDEQDISNTWSGNKKSKPVPFASQADSIIVKAVVLEKDTFSDDDISPGYYVIFYPPFYEGRASSYTLDYGSGKSMVKFNYEFVWQ